MSVISCFSSPWLMSPDPVSSSGMEASTGRQTIRTWSMVASREAVRVSVTCSLREDRVST